MMKFKDILSEAYEPSEDAMMKFKLLQERAANAYPPIFKYLAAEARKCKTWEEYEYEFTKQYKRGIYYHLTDSPKFELDTKRPAKYWGDSFDKPTYNEPGTIYVTCDPQYWSATFSDPNTDEPSRKFCAIIDLSNVPMKDYVQTQSGDGSEFVVHNDSNARVIKTMTLEQAITFDNKYTDLLEDHFQDKEDMKRFYDWAVGNQSKVGKV